MQQRTEIVPHAQAIAYARVEAGYSKLDIARAAGIPHSSVRSHPPQKGFR